MSAAPQLGLPTWQRRAIVAAIVLVLGSLFVYREFLQGAEPEGPGIIDAGQRVAVGERAPDFALELAGSDDLVRLSDFRGQTVLLNFWATWCGPCRYEMPDFQEVYEHREGDDDFVVIAVNVQEPDTAVTRFTEEFGLTFPVMMDRTGSVMQHYSVPGLPATFFIDREGVVRQRSLGPIVGDMLQDGIDMADQAAESPAS